MGNNQQLTPILQEKAMGQLEYDASAGAGQGGMEETHHAG